MIYYIKNVIPIRSYMMPSNRKLIIQNSYKEISEKNNEHEKKKKAQLSVYDSTIFYNSDLYVCYTF